MNLREARERWVRTGGIELCVAELGDPAQPTVVLVHGYPDSKEVWSDVAGQLARQWHVVLYDVRGHGRSTAPTPLRGGFTLEKLTDDFLAVVDAVSPNRPVHVVGHDWGSVQSWEFATVSRTEGRIASFTSMSGPSLDHFGHWIKQRMSRPTPRGVGQLLGQGPSPGTCTCCTRPYFPSSPGAARWASSGHASSNGWRRSPRATIRRPPCRGTPRTGPGSTVTTSGRGCAGRAPMPTRMCRSS
ncbi:alpha/beta fold hydrolase [Streptomyces sp. M10(2022)]